MPSQLLAASMDFAQAKGMRVCIGSEQPTQHPSSLTPTHCAVRLHASPIGNGGGVGHSTGAALPFGPEKT